MARSIQDALEYVYEGEDITGDVAPVPNQKRSPAESADTGTDNRINKRINTQIQINTQINKPINTRINKRVNTRINTRTKKRRRRHAKERKPPTPLEERHHGDMYATSRGVFGKLPRIVGGETAAAARRRILSYSVGTHTRFDK
jgi:hypothetical protein